jgi:hypothetical protein
MCRRIMAFPLPVRGGNNNFILKRSCFLVFQRYTRVASHPTKERANNIKNTTIADPRLDLFFLLGSLSLYEALTIARIIAITKNTIVAIIRYMLSILIHKRKNIFLCMLLDT